jgi:1,4-dihydroxy-2-naphthoyl-CoA hydrolase
MSATLEAELNRAVTGFDRLYGLEFVSCGVSEEEVSACVRIDERHRQPMGLVHGGLYATVAESIATVATVLSVAGDGNIAVGLSNNTSFLRPITEGSVHASGRRRHAGRTTWVWDVEMSDDEGRLCALTRVTMAVRPRPA